jgi:benzoyl-CoA reductase subunit A
MNYSVGIDLGSTTTKAIILGEDGGLLGRGITNSRSNYKVACDVALCEALINTRFALVSGELASAGVAADRQEKILRELELGFREQQYLAQLVELDRSIRVHLEDYGYDGGIRSAVDRILESMRTESGSLFAEGANRKSDFFRDLAGARYLHMAEEVARGESVAFDPLVGLFDKSILDVENLPVESESFQANARAAFERMPETPPELGPAVDRAAEVPLVEEACVGTGYGRKTLPFPKEQIRSEILCHGLGAHAMFPETRTVLDIGGQDTKAIQTDAVGIVTSFQMNDRCAAGCGRYLGYIADEMNLGVHELGPMACKSERPVKINSTCTVFAGAELRERLSLGQRREDIVAGLHRAIILRAMSLLARSGGVNTEFTFTGGVARNEAAVAALRDLIRENYGEIKMNISPDSIYTGALGAALFARRELEQPGEQPSGSEGQA